MKKKQSQRRKVDMGKYKHLCSAMPQLLAGPLRLITKFPCVTGYGLGLKTIKGKTTNRLSMIIGVIKKKTLKQIPVSGVFPKSFHIPNPKFPKQDIVVETDIIETGIIRPHGIECDRIRPCRSGYSIAHKDVSCGTLGCWVIDGATTEPLFLSNNHVIANSNHGSVGDDIYQPCPYCTGTPSDNKFGTLHRYVELSGYDNLVDAAVGKPLDDNWVDHLVIGLGEPTGTIDLNETHLGMLLSGFGNQSGVHTGSTRNEILSVDWNTVPIAYDRSKKSTQYYSFIHQILLDNDTKQPYIPGDSGTVYLLEDGDDLLLAGLNFAGSDAHAIGNHIRYVFSELNVTYCVVESSSSNASTLHTLRDFRDNILIKTALGKDIVKILRDEKFRLAQLICLNPHLRTQLKELTEEVATAVKRNDLHLSKPLPKIILDKFLPVVYEVKIPAGWKLKNIQNQVKKVLSQNADKKLTTLLKYHIMKQKNKRR